ncbi:testis-expressed protein 10 homolog [Acipenser ruthenus]|uniref:testis-expressed protein 10 homolog n=1 Tax=Acipenser ruthenus TaxID=7906 RepID=UPI002740CC3E|nr:testis-expressed protein 10 homolog [Acipenser ruthenus]XP_033849617.3 testis-expressed protein 10 homolog [Acipenser ruthenus]XP_058868934.1 testis-expressed protein 10 homolog [Acipenser ruthenus]
MSKKRKRQDDFQKVKLKVGKKKPKPDNATNVNFKTKGIHLPDQLKRDGALPTNHRQLNVKDLLTQMHHYSPGVKLSALTGLKDLLSQHASVLDTHLSSILSEVAAVFTDKDPPVRAAAIRLLQFLGPRVAPEHIAPFFPLVSAHLSSAMTHIVDGIQEDALKVLDVLLEHYPQLLTGRSTVLLKNFVELISHQRLSKALKGGRVGKSPSWMLSVSPGRRLTSQQWRLSVLLRLSKYLQALAEEQGGAGEDGRQVPSDEREKGKAGSGFVTMLEVTWDEHSFGTKGIQVYENSGAQPSVRSCFRLRPVSGVSAEEGLSSVESLKGFVQTLVPLLLECWVEASPADQAASSPGNLVESEAMLLMHQVLWIIQLLRTLVQLHDHSRNMDSWFRTNYLSDFKHHFMKNFPYSQLDIPKKKKKGDSKRNKQAAALLASVDALALNLALSQVMVSLTSSTVVQQDSDWLEAIRKFVTHSLLSGSKLSSKQLSGLLEVVWRLTLTQRNRAVTEELLRAVHVQYQQRSLTLPVRMQLLRFFSGLYLKEKEANPQIARSKVLSRWLSGLPLQLAQLGARNTQLSAQLIETIHAAASRSNRELLQSLQTHACRLYDPEDGSVVLLPPESQQRLVQLVYFLPSLPSDLLSCLSHCCSMGRISSSLAGALFRIVHIRSSFSGWTGCVQETAVTDVDYFSFLFSSLTGFSGDELALLQRGNEDGHTSRMQLSPVLLYPTDLEQFGHNWDVAQEVCHCLETVSSRPQCFDILQNAICKNLAGLRVVPDSTAAAVLSAVSRLLVLAYIPSEVLLRFLASCCYSLLHHLLTLEKSAAEDSAHKREVVWGACLAALSGVPRVLRLMLQSLRVTDACQEELPVIAQILRLLLQHAQLRNHMMANAALLQQIVQEITRFRSTEAREQWLVDLHYCFSVCFSSQPRGPAATRENY